MNESFTINHRFFCQRSGIQIGTLEFITTAGTLPYLSQWKDSVCYHPVFAMQPNKLLVFARDEWQRLAQRVLDSEITEHESEILRVCHLALLHSLESIKQDEPALPSLSIVQGSIEALFTLAGWKFFLESQRFKFPTLHLARRNNNLDFSNLRDYLNLCFEVKNDYETKVSETVEKAKIDAADRAMAMLRSEWAVPSSKKMLFQWIKAHLPDKYKPDGDGWLATLFLGTDKVIQSFEHDDLALFEEIIYASCPVGNSIFKAVRERTEAIKLAWVQHHEAWEIDLGSDDWDEETKLLVNGVPILPADAGPEPRCEEFASRGKFLQAHAKWTIAQARSVKDKGATI